MTDDAPTEFPDWVYKRAADLCGFIPEFEVHYWQYYAKEHPSFRALCRAIEQHEAFRQEVSDALKEVGDTTTWGVHPKLWRFIIAKADPLVEALDEALWEVSNVKLTDRELRAVSLRLNAKRGGKIVWGEG